MSDGPPVSNKQIPGDACMLDNAQMERTDD